MNGIIAVYLMACLSVPCTMALSGAAQKYFVGFDLGTSGARISVIAETASSSSSTLREVHSASLGYVSSHDDPYSWKLAIHELLINTPPLLRNHIHAICVSGTSASCLIVDVDTGTVRRPKMYNYDVILNDSQSHSIMKTIQRFAPTNHTVLAPTSTLAKLLHYHAESPLTSNQQLMHQADYVASTFLTSRPSSPYTSFSDWHNALKLGYDVQQLEWPLWIRNCLHHLSIPLSVLPEHVVSPGQIIDTIDPNVASIYGIPNHVVITGGTTDSNAAFFAAASQAICSTSRTATGPTAGIAVTSLGSTLAIKMTSSRFIEDASRGVYSHRFPSSFDSTLNTSPLLWLVGGASNVGCAILRQEQYSNQELEECSRQINPKVDSLLNYYPLTKQGERFPFSDSLKLPIMEPKPIHNDRIAYLHAILQGIAKVECLGYQVLGELGAQPSFPSMVWTCGGGSKNDMWTKMRERLLLQQCKDMNMHSEYQATTIAVRRALHSEASFGAAVLAASTFIKRT
jgi:sugar (pentulose or hexulose) kinase